MKAHAVIQLMSLVTNSLALTMSEFSVVSTHLRQSDAYPRVRIYGRISDTRTRATRFPDDRPIDRREVSHVSHKGSESLSYSTYTLRSNSFINPLNKRALRSSRKGTSITPNRSIRTSQSRPERSLGLKSIASPSQRVHATLIGLAKPLNTPRNIRTRPSRATNDRNPEDKPEIKNDESIEKDASKKARRVLINSSVALFGAALAVAPKFFPVNDKVDNGITVCGLLIACQQWSSTNKNAERDREDAIKEGKEKADMLRRLGVYDQRLGNLERKVQNSEFQELQDWYKTLSQGSKDYRDWSNTAGQSKKLEDAERESEKKPKKDG